MKLKLRLDKKDSDDIAFAEACLVSGVLEFSEFKEWLCYVVGHQDQVPAYFWEILDIENKFNFKPLSVMRFNPSWKHAESESDALDGIGYRRWGDFVSDAVPRDLALQALEKNPHIEQRFKEMFPFIDW